MQMTADFFGCFHDCNQIIRQIFRMRRHKPNPLQSLNLLYHLQKLRKGDRLFQIFSVRIHILPKQHDLNYPVCHQTFNLPDNILRLPAPLPAPHIRHNTIAAEVVAAKHDIYT